MRKSSVKQAFTLVEMLIVLVATAILMGVLFQTYRTVSDIALRVRQEKQIGDRVVTLQTMLQNIVDVSSIYYTGVSALSMSPRQLSEQQLIQERQSNSNNSDGQQSVGRQQLNANLLAQNSNVPTGWTKQIPLIKADGVRVNLSIQSGSILMTTISGNDEKTVSLLGDDMMLENGYFVLYPMNDPQKADSFDKIFQPGFWLIGDLKPQMTTNIHFPIQTYFTILQR